MSRDRRNAGTMSDVLGYALLAFGAGVIGACIWLMTLGWIAAGYAVVILVVVVPLWLMVAAELRE